jgi:hypothetical protein
MSKQIDTECNLRTREGRRFFAPMHAVTLSAGTVSCTNGVPLF